MGSGAARIAAAMGVWSTWSLFVRWLPVPPWAVTFYVGIVCTVVTAALWVGRGGAPRDLWPRQRLGLLAAMGALFVANGVMFFTAFRLTTVSNAILSHYTAPVFVAALAPLTLGERLSPRTPAALGLAGVGMALLLPGVELTLHGSHLQGLLLGTGSGVSYAGLILLSRHLGPRVPPPLLLFYQNAAAVLVLAPWGLRLGLPGEAGTWGWLLLLGAVHGTAAGFLYLAGIRRVTAQTAAVLGYLEPLGAVALAAVFLGERPGALGLLGGALVLAGGGLVAFEPQPEAP